MERFLPDGLKAIVDDKIARKWTGCHDTESRCRGMKTEKSRRSDRRDFRSRSFL
jgi:hypothetical protein